MPRPRPRLQEAPAQTAPASTAAQQAPAVPSQTSDALSPSAKRAAGETGVDPSTVPGTGKDGRVTRVDIEGAATTAKAPSTPAPAPAPAASSAAMAARKSACG